MNYLQKSRLMYITLMIVGVSVAMGLILFALKKNINVFLTPKQINTALLPVNYHFRLGGMVKKNSIIREKNNLTVTFIVTDLKKEIIVTYTGVLPDLFHEGKGVIAEGSLNSQGVFAATQIFAKHDENYMPKKMYEELRKNENA